MISLTYISSARRPMEPAELTELLVRWRTNNAAADITGLLLYANDAFIQTLEGDAEPVHDVMRRIAVDPRHFDVDVTLDEEIEARSFPDWSMGFRHLGPGEISVAGFSHFLEADTVRVEHRDRLSRAGVFHQVFRDTMGRERWGSQEAGLRSWPGPSSPKQTPSA